VLKARVVVEKGLKVRDIVVEEFGGKSPKRA
jgi:hypothetical protein